jgi:hypothetical protein
MHNEEPQNYYSSPNVITVIKSWRPRWKKYIAYTEEMRNAYNILVRKPELEETTWKTKAEIGG